MDYDNVSGLGEHVTCHMFRFLSLSFWATVCTQAGLGLGHIVLDGDPAPPKGRGTADPTFRPMSIVAFVAKRLDGSRCHLVWR